MCLYLLYSIFITSRHPRGRHYYTKTRHTGQVALTGMPMHISQQKSLFISLFKLSVRFFFFVDDSPVEPLLLVVSTRSRPISLFPPSLIWTTFPHSQHLSYYSTWHGTHGNPSGADIMRLKPPRQEAQYRASASFLRVHPARSVPEIYPKYPDTNWSFDT